MGQTDGLGMGPATFRQPSTRSPRVSTRALVCACALVFGVALAGCESTPTPQQAPYQPPVHQPSQQFVQNSAVVSVAAGSATAWPFTITGTAVDVTYQWTRSDDSAVGIGFIRAADWAEYQTGQTVSSYAWNNQAGTITDHHGLAPDDYDLVIQCQNTVAACDGTLSIYYYS